MTFMEAIDVEINRTKHDAFMLTERIKALEALRDVYSKEKPLTLSGNMVEAPLKVGATEARDAFTILYLTPDHVEVLINSIKAGSLNSALVDENTGGIVAYGSEPMIQLLLGELN